MKFKGFPAGKVIMTPMPGPFFSELLPAIDNLAELKLTLYLFWRLNRMEGAVRFLRYEDFSSDELFMRSISENPGLAEASLDDALARAVQRGTLLIATHATEQTEVLVYFLNTARGRAAVQAIQRGELLPEVGGQIPDYLSPDPPNIFRLYEENIGALTPMIAESLEDAERTYPAQWIEQAFRIAVERNVRNWRYIEAILNRWQTEGRDEQKDRQDAETTGRKYIEGEYSEYIEH